MDLAISMTWRTLRESRMKLSDEAVTEQETSLNPLGKEQCTARLL